jgi:hypothetical protein
MRRSLRCRFSKYKVCICPTSRSCVRRCGKQVKLTLVVAGGPGLEPELTGPKPAVLPLDDPPIKVSCLQRRKSARNSVVDWEHCYLVLLTMHSYVIRETTEVLFDSPKNIDFHIRTGDYFSVLATVMGFMEEALTVCEHVPEAAYHKTLARELRHDLRYVQANYQIEPRPMHEIQQVPTSGNLLAR